jgi:hypothetical protein
MINPAIPVRSTGYLGSRPVSRKTALMNVLDSEATVSGVTVRVDLPAGREITVELDTAGYRQPEQPAGWTTWHSGDVDLAPVSAATHLDRRQRM